MTTSNPNLEENYNKTFVAICKSTSCYKCIFTCIRSSDYVYVCISAQKFVTEEIYAKCEEPHQACIIGMY